MSSLNDVSGMPTEGKNLVVVAAVNHVLHFRIFGGDGKVVVDTDEKRLTEQARRIEDLRKQLESLWPPHELTRSDEGRVITAITSIVDLTHAMSLRYIRTLQGEEPFSPMRGIVFIPGKNTIAMANEAGRISVCDITSGKSMGIKEIQHAIMVLAVSHDGSLLATGYRDGSCNVWKVPWLEQCAVFSNNEGGRINGIAFSPKGERLALSYLNKTVKLWDTRTRSELFRLAGHMASVNGIAFSPDGKRLASASADETVKVWDVDSAGEELWTGQFPSTYVNRAVFFPDDRLVALAMADGTCQIWEPRAKRRTVPPFHGHEQPVNCVAVNANGTWAVTGGADWQVRVWDTTSGKEKLRPLLGHSQSVNSVAISPDEEYIASGSADCTVRIWKVSSGQQYEWYKHSSIVNAVAFHPKEAIVGIAGENGMARLWDIARGDKGFQLSHVPYGIRDATFSPDGELFATAGEDAVVRLWDTRTGAQKHNQILEGPLGWINGVAFSPDGKTIATAGSDKTCRIWDAKTGDELIVLVGHTAVVKSVIFSANGRYLLTAGADRTVRLWILDIEELLIIAKQRITRDLTPHERRKFLREV